MTTPCSPSTLRFTVYSAFLKFCSLYINMHRLTSPISIFLLRLFAHHPCPCHPLPSYLAPALPAAPLPPPGKYFARIFCFPNMQRLASFISMCLSHVWTILKKVFYGRTRKIYLVQLRLRGNWAILE